MYAVKEEKERGRERGIHLFQQRSLRDQDHDSVLDGAVWLHLVHLSTSWSLQNDKHVCNFENCFFFFFCNFLMLRNKSTVCKFHVFHERMLRVVHLRPDSRDDAKHQALRCMCLSGTVKETARRSKFRWNTDADDDDSHVYMISLPCCKGVISFYN